jgi:DNA mismatch repair protein MutL
LTHLDEMAAAKRFSSLRVVGQTGGTFLLLEGPDGLVVVDQHAAHERVVFERLKTQRQARGVPSQPLLIPHVMEASIGEVSALDDEKTQHSLQHHGLLLEPFGPRQVIVKGIPVGLSLQRVEHIARDVLKELMDERAGALDERDDAVCARLACHAAVRAGDTMAIESIRSLLHDLDAIDLGAHCPHGRPVAHTLPFADMAGWFDRR